MIKHSNEQTLKEVIKALLDAYKRSDGLQESKLIQSWDKTVGHFVAKNTEKVYIRNKVLFVKLNPPALKHELSFAKSNLVSSLNKAVGTEVITDIVFL